MKCMFPWGKKDQVVNSHDKIKSIVTEDFQRKSYLNLYFVRSHYQKLNIAHVYYNASLRNQNSENFYA